MLNSTDAPQLIRLYKIFTRPYTEYDCTAVTALNKKRKQKLEVIQNHCLRYARRAVDCTSISYMSFVHVVILLALNNTFLP